ncbi:fungal-specific transcription factor domain-containing protein [Plectosphaerella plurivora]|uniref:Fungal-specific transcription factor domain-containing protein n=1 Tax=Plectosphaerella plurivora TaxID=936078 RepID=A0A9P9AEH1_9PEZI|nr:fungal-specific transcription factor domain-containing protein [Plectosphaerella plurivora]
MSPSFATPTDAGMFHNFQVQGSAQPSVSGPLGTADTADGRSVKISQACAECKRRKIRCDGQHPCRQCISTRVPKRCFYDKHRPRVVPSRKVVENLSQSLEECRSVLGRLFPDQDVSSLLPLSREELLELLQHPTAADGEAALPSPPILNASPLLGDDDDPADHETDPGAAELEQMPTRDSEWDEERRDHEPIPVESDDVNALSLTMDRRASYLGASSVKAALMVMLKLQPQLRQGLASRNAAALGSTTNAPSVTPLRRASLAAAAADAKPAARVPWSWRGQTFVDAYFKRVHAFIPMLDEATFRADYSRGHRTDSPWLALLHAVLAIGSVAATKSSDLHHEQHYHQAMAHLTLDSFGSSRVETVQALAIIGGYYLHYVNRPNMANALLGAAVRMASALGLHRESLAQDSSESDMMTAEIRRRTWWSLFCLDTWATTTLGRPSFGRRGPGINIRPPELGMSQAAESAQYAGVLPIIENIKFCRIATQVQDTLAASPLLSTEDRQSMDAQLVSWYDGLPWLLRTTQPCAEPLYIARCVTKWRYQNLRMLLHRPVLLTLASNHRPVPSRPRRRASHAPSSASSADMDTSPGTGAGPGDDEDFTASLDACSDMAGQTIHDISREWTRNQMLGWNAAWFLYQAVMIPLLRLAWQPLDSRNDQWRAQIEMTLDLLDAMGDWSLTATRSREVVRRVYETVRSAADMAAGMPGSDPSQAFVGAGLMEQIGEDVEFRMSPIRLDTDVDVAGLMDQDWMWDLDGMFWGQPGQPGVQQGMMQQQQPEGIMDNMDGQDPGVMYGDGTVLPMHFGGYTG